MEKENTFEGIKRMDMEPKKQVFVLPGISNDLSGKTVKEIAFHLGRYHLDENQVILTFTDNTFIAFGIERDEDDIMLVNNHFPPLESYGIYPPHKIDANGNVCFEDYIQQQINLGVIKPMSEERLKQLVEDYNNKQRERDRQQYLRLKEMFEKEEAK